MKNDRLFRTLFFTLTFFFEKKKKYKKYKENEKALWAAVP